MSRFKKCFIVCSLIATRCIQNFVGRGAIFCDIKSAHIHCLPPPPPPNKKKSCPISPRTLMYYKKFKCDIHLFYLYYRYTESSLTGRLDKKYIYTHTHSLNWCRRTSTTYSPYLLFSLVFPLYTNISTCY